MAAARGRISSSACVPWSPSSITPKYPLTLAIPAKIGLSLNDYYEGPTGSNKFGYFDLGGILSVPSFMNGKSTWEVHGGVDLLWLGDNVKLLNGGDGVKPVAVVGFSVIY